MKVSEDGLALIREFEGKRLTAYRDAVGIWTVGFGHTGPDVHEGMMITEAEADAFLREDVKDAERCVNKYVTDIALLQCQFDALVSFVFNLGCGALRRSTLLQCLLDGDDDAAAREFIKWNRAGGQVLAGLTRRREAEAEMFRRIA